MMYELLSGKVNRRSDSKQEKTCYNNHGVNKLTNMAAVRKITAVMMGHSSHSGQDNTQPQVETLREEQLRAEIMWLRQTLKALANLTSCEHRKDGYRPCNCSLCRN